MTNEVWKFVLPFQDEVTIDMPKGAEIISVANQYETLCVWCLVPQPVKERQSRRFRIIETGHPIDCSMSLRFIGTVLFVEGSLVFHVFEIS